MSWYSFTLLAWPANKNLLVSNPCSSEWFCLRFAGFLLLLSNFFSFSRGFWEWFWFLFLGVWEPLWGFSVNSFFLFSCFWLWWFWGLFDSFDLEGVGSLTLFSWGTTSLNSLIFSIFIVSSFTGLALIIGFLSSGWVTDLFSFFNKALTSSNDKKATSVAFCNLIIFVKMLKLLILNSASW